MNFDSRITRGIGFWSALLVATSNVAYFIAFVLYQPVFNAPWPGLAAYAVAFKPRPFLAWVVPCFVLAVAFLIMMACVFSWTRESKKAWSLLALVFAAPYTTVLGTHYFIQMTVIPHALVTQQTEGLSLWLYAYNIPHNLPFSLEGVGYSFMSLSVIFASFVFEKTKLQQWTRWAFLGVGISGLALPYSLLGPLPTRLVPISLGLFSLFLTLAPMLLAVLFRRNEPV